MEQEAWARSQIDALTSQVASLKTAMAVVETERTMADATWNEAEQGHQRLEAKCQKLRSACGGQSPSTLHCAFTLLLCLVMNQLFFLGMHARALSDQEEKAGCEPEDAGVGQPAGSAN